MLKGTGISWNVNGIDDITSATTRFDSLAPSPGWVWAEWLARRHLEPAQMTLLPGMFESALELGRTRELDSAVVRLVNETPTLPTSSAGARARLAAEVAETFGPYEWHGPHPWAAVFPGLSAQHARRFDRTVILDASGSELPADASSGWHHLPPGLYAPSSTLVAIEIPASHATGELRMSMGELQDGVMFL